MDKISVIVPVYNVETTVGKCIESILNQTFSDIELIVVNDGTPDKSMEVVEKYKQDKRIKIVNKENAGLPQARKTGFENSTGEYIFFVDSDDWIEPNTLELLYRAIKSANADIACCNIEVDYLNSDRKEYIKAKKTGEFSRHESIRMIHDMNGIFQYAWNKLYCRKVIRENNFPKGHFIGEDYCTVLAIMENVLKITQIPECLYHYVQNEGSMTKMGFGQTYILAYQWNNKVREKLILKYPDLKREIMSYHILQDMAVLNAMFRNDCYNEVLKDAIIINIRKHIGMYITKSNVKLMYKVCAVFIVVNWKVYRFIYKRIYL